MADPLDFLSTVGDWAKAAGDAAGAIGTGISGIVNTINDTAGLQCDKLFPGLGSDTGSAATPALTDSDAWDRIVAKKGDPTAYMSEGTGGSSFFDKLKKSIGDAYDKDPMKAIELGLGTVGGMYNAAEKRKALATQAQSYIDAQNNAARLEKEKTDRYNASFTTGRKRTTTASPLKRIGGNPVFDANGNYVR